MANMIKKIKFQNKKVFFAFIFFSTIFFRGFSQEDSEQKINRDINFFFTLGPVIQVNTDSSSAPNPVNFTAGIGLDFFTGKIIGLELKTSFFTGYALWDGKIFRPAEIENRTALVFNSLWDIDATHSWAFSSSQLQICAGLSFLLRYAILANGIKSSQTSKYSTGTAGDDVKDINKSFYSDFNFLYPNLGLTWLYDFNAKWKAGFETKLYFPLGAIIDGRGLDSMLISIGVKALLVR
ncbi:hypothetical protein [Treponema pectinovorum]|uniref:hypothetical protein n=1 Tax=Treponema pectinovorum TaxID=164 RepID=UPI0011F2769C|nr:hypothetical protein [Treponema pectinovorum]